MYTHMYTQTLAHTGKWCMQEHLIDGHNATCVATQSHQVDNKFILFWKVIILNNVSIRDCCLALDILNLCRFILSIFKCSDVEDNRMASPLVEKGKDCLALAKSVHLDVVSGDNIEEKLKKLERNSDDLAHHAKQKVIEIEELEEYYKQKVEDHQKTLMKLKSMEEELRQQKLRMQFMLNGKQEILSAMRMTLSNAESDLYSAKDRLSRAIKQEEERVVGVSFFGAFVGTLIAPVIGTAIGAAAGAGAGGLLNELIDAETKAQNRVDDCRSRCRGAESDVQSTQSQIDNIQSQISSLSSQCDSMKSQQDQYTAKAKKMKEALLFFRKASLFWKEFQQAAESADKNTELMQAVITKAKEKQDLEWLTCRGSKVLGVTFLEAWALIETKREEGTEFGFQIE